MFRKIFTVVSILLLITSVAIAQTGRILGKVVDQQSDEPLIGANVIVVGTSLGAATDVNGSFIISQVPPGNYSVKASYIGYQDVTVEQIRVVTGLSAEVNFRLPSSTIATGEVVIVSQRPLIEKSATNAVRIVSAEDIQSLPVRSIAAILALQPGVVQQNGNTFIRGSRADETGYILEGADVKNVYSRNGGSLVTVSPDALQELLVQAGGYTAEYGNANAGIVQQDFKTGTDKYHFSVRAETDNFGNANSSDRFLGTYSYGYSDYTVTLSGPVISDKLKLFVTGENNFMRDYNPQFLYGSPTAFSTGQLLDTTKVYDTGINGGNKTDYQYLNWSSGSIPGRMQNRYTFNGTALLDLKPLLIKAAGAFTWQRQRGNDWTYNSVSPVPGGATITDLSNIYNLSRLPLDDNSNLLLNLKGTYFLSSNSYVEANFNYLDWRDKTYDPYMQDNFLDYADSLKAAAYGFTYTNYTSQPAPYNFFGFDFTRPGNYLTNYIKQQRNYLGGSAAFTTQLGKHEFKAGGSYQRWTLRRYSVTAASTLLLDVRDNPDQSRNLDSLNFLLQNTGYRSFNNYGYDLFGNSIDNGNYAPKHPVFASGYIQDKLELSDLIINAGLRYDYINMDSWKWENPLNPTSTPDTHLPIDLVNGNTFSYVSPRLGFSFPVTDRTVFHMQYGKFVQAPSLDIAYRGILQVSTVITAANLYTNPIAYNPQPIRTTQYEVGFTQQFTDFAAMDITAFYKDIKGQVQYTEIQTEAGAAKAQYAAFINQDFATTKGLELSLKVRRVERVRAEINYTYSDAKGTNSFLASGIGSVEVSKNVPTVILPLTYDQTHRGSIMLDYRFGKDDGGPILQQLGLNLLFTFNSGHPYTLAQSIDQTGLGQARDNTGGLIPALDTRGRRTSGPVNQATTPWYYNLDLRVDKTVSLYNLDVNFYVYVMNVLNTKNVINVYDRTGNGYDDGFLDSAPGRAESPQFRDLYSNLNLGNQQAAETVMNLNMFSAPRQIRAGVLINF
ncbi:MAG: TonB-dependent receptor [Ignavibacteriaceae bacterium]